MFNAGSTFTNDDSLWSRAGPASAVCSISKRAVMTCSQMLQQPDLFNQPHKMAYSHKSRACGGAREAFLD